MKIVNDESLKKENLCTFQAVDAGDSMYVHAFGAYFGLAVSFVFGVKDKPKQHHLEGSTYQSDIFAMIGKRFLSQKYLKWVKI